MQRFFFLQVDDKNSGDYSADKTTKWIAIKKKEKKRPRKAEAETKDTKSTKTIVARSIFRCLI